MKIALYRLRAEFYRLFHTIGKNCHFQKITFDRTMSGPSGKKAIKIGNNVTILRDTVLIASDDRPIEIGDGSFVSHRCLLNSNVLIGKNVGVGAGTMFFTGNHEIGPPDRRAGENRFGRIVIEDGCWIGANTTILSGVTIGKSTIVGACSLVNRDLDANSVYFGIPARKQKTLTDAPAPLPR